MELSLGVLQRTKRIKRMFRLLRCFRNDKTLLDFIVPLCDVC